MELYKYCQLDHMLAMKERGAVRVGALFDYRKTESHGEMVADGHEDNKVMSGTIHNLTPETLDKYPGLDRIVSFRVNQTKLHPYAIKRNKKAIS